MLKSDQAHPFTVLVAPRIFSVPNSKTFFGAISVAPFAFFTLAHSGTASKLLPLLGPEDTRTLGTINTLANTYYFQGKYSEAAELYSQTVEIGRRVRGPEHPDTLTGMNNLAIVDYLQGKYAESEPLLMQILEIRRRVLGADHPRTLEVLSDLANLYQRQGAYREAETYAEQCLAGMRRTFGLDHPRAMGAANDLALAYQSQGKFAESEPLARHSVEVERQKQPEDWERFRSESLLGNSLLGQKKYAEAEPLLLAGYRGMADRKARTATADWYHLDRAREWLAQLYQAWGKPEKAAGSKQ
jgi:tetratricopeptide (TPR) repeat protein